MVHVLVSVTLLLFDIVDEARVLQASRPVRKRTTRLMVKTVVGSSNGKLGSAT